MPVSTTFQEIQEANTTGITKTTRVLQATFDLRSQTAITDIQNEPPIKGLPQWLQDALDEPFPNAGDRLKAVERRHLRDWPDAQKEQVRQAVRVALAAAPGKHVVRFFWRLDDSLAESTRIETSVVGGVTTTVITFFTPRARIKPTAIPGDYHVGVLPTDPH